MPDLSQTAQGSDSRSFYQHLCIAREREVRAVLTENVITHRPDLEYVVLGGSVDVELRSPDLIWSPWNVANS